MGWSNIRKGMQIYLNTFKTILLTYLQHKYVGRHIRNILFSTTSSAHQKDKVLRDGDFFHATIKDSDQWARLNQILIREGADARTLGQI